VGLERGTIFQVPSFCKNSPNEWGSNSGGCIISLVKGLPTVIDLLIPSLYMGLGKGEDKEVVLQPFTATSDQAMVQGSCL
jgi:hypothetical protein